MLNFEESKQLVGCTSNSSCIAEIGGAIGVAKVVSGSIGKLGSSYVVNLSLLDTKSARVIERESRTVPTSDKLAEETEAAARFLVRSLLERRQGDMFVKASEINAEIEIDGKLVGMAPMPRMKLASGPHTLRVSKKGFVTFARDVLVDEKEPMMVDATLLPSLDFIEDYDRKANLMRTMAWVTGGVGVAALASSLIVWWGWNDQRLAKHNKQKDAIDAAGGPTQAQFTQINNDAASIQTTYTICYIVGAVGGAAMAASVVLFLVGPRPGVYDQYRTVEVGGAKVSFDLAPAPGGAFGSAFLRW
jgi:hypothetical protein